MNKKELQKNCILCRRSSKSILVDEGILEIFKFLIPKLDIDTLGGSRLCVTCLKSIHKAYSFKTLCLAKFDYNFKIKKEMGISDNNICYTCKQLLNGTSSDSLHRIITKNNMQDTIVHLISKLPQQLEEIQRICSSCQSTIKSICNVFTLLSIHKQREQIDNNSSSESIPKNGCTEKNEIVKVDLSNENCFANNIKIKEEIDDLALSAIEERSDEIMGITNYDDFMCKNEEVDLKTEINDEDYSEGNLTVIEQEDKTANLDVKSLKKPDKVTIHKCPICEYQTKHKYCLKKHMVIHKNAEDVTWYTCTECSFQTKHKQSFVSHKLVHKSPNEIEMYQCDVCEYQTKFKANIKRHVLLHKDCDQIEMFKCNLCQYASKFKHQLEHHKIVHKKPEEIKWFFCPLCPFKTKRNCDLTRHKITHKNPNQMNMYQCQLCDFRTKFKYNLKPHMIVHKKANEIKWYKCSECSYQFKRKYTLEQHMLIHKKPDEIELFKCQYCDFQTKRKYNLSGHMINHYDLIKE